jgi:hypothetical protein
MNPIFYKPFIIPTTLKRGDTATGMSSIYGDKLVACSQSVIYAGISSLDTCILEVVL